MRSNFGKLPRIAIALLVILLITAVALLAASEIVLRRKYTIKPEAFRATATYTVPEGRRLAKLYGCTSCHGADYRGLRYNDDPQLPRTYAPNLTLIAAHSSDGELALAIRQGVRARDGQALWGMPSATFSSITDAELQSVLAHLRSLPTGGSSMRGPAPGVRARIAILRGLFGDGPGTQHNAPTLITDAKERPPVDLGPKYARGRHIAATVCSECHGSDLAGDEREGGPDLTIAGSYDLAAFRHLLRTGIPPGGRNLGLMTQTAQADLKVFTDAEIDALYAYLVARAGAN